MSGLYRVAEGLLSCVISSRRWYALSYASNWQIVKYTGVIWKLVNKRESKHLVTVPVAEYTQCQLQHGCKLMRNLP